MEAGISYCHLDSYYLGGTSSDIRVGYPSSASLIRFSTNYHVMTEEPVLDWDRVIHKNVRASDMSDVGNIIQIAGDSIRIMEGSKRQYNVPKRLVDGFDGSEVTLRVPYSEMRNYEVR
jgi:hypothetical protein